MTFLYDQQNNVGSVVGDICSPDTIIKIWDATKGAGLMTAGFACQPYSALGDGRGSADARSLCLRGVLAGAFFLGVQALALECVQLAAKHEYVKSEIQKFLDATGFHCEQVDLHLHDIWPSRRNRAWWMITSPLIGKLTIPPLPKLSMVSTVMHVIGAITRCDDSDELALKLDSVEEAAFGVHDGSVHKYLLNFAGTAPCALHLWGSQVVGCACGCRMAGLSPHRLAEKGLFGLLVQRASDSQGNHHVRHTHPNEVSALNGFDPMIDFGPTVRLTLSAAGQLASPLQSCWVLAHLAERLDIMQFGTSKFSPLAELQAYMTWMISRCRQVWPVHDEPIQDSKFLSLVEFWKNAFNLSIHELVHPPRWPDLCDQNVTCASILDHLIRSRTPCATEVDETQVDMPAAEAMPVDQEIPCFVAPPPLHQFPDPSPDLCTVLFLADDSTPICIRVTEGSTVRQLFQAHVHLVGMFPVTSVTDAHGIVIDWNQVVEAGQVVVFHCDDMHDSLPSIGTAAIEESNVHPDWFEKPDSHQPVECTPTAIWSQPVEDPNSNESMPGPLPCDIGRAFRASPDALSDQSWISAAPLLCLRHAQFLQLSVPKVGNDQELWSLRHQLLQTEDRLQLLEQQGPVWADDELRFHLEQLRLRFAEYQAKFSSSKVRQCCVIDPLLISGWIQHGDARCREWGSFHPESKNEGRIVITAVMFNQHWVPVVMKPTGTSLHVFVWDAQSQDHTRLNELITALGHSLGFEVLINRSHRLFFASDMCGALAMVFLHHSLLDVMLPSSHDEACCIHDRFRTEFRSALPPDQLAFRPWVWGEGDPDPAPIYLSEEYGNFETFPIAANSPLGFGLQGGFAHTCVDRDLRIDLLQQHDLAWGDDEIRYHIASLIQHPNNVARQGLVHCPEFLMLEPLLLSTWETVGRALCEAWCHQHPEIRTHGHEIVTAALVDSHWIPIWCVPRQTTLIAHVLDDGTDIELAIRPLLQLIATALDFEEIAIHWFPTRVRDHDLCGAATIAFLGHVIVWADMPPDVRTLRDMHTDMRASFVDAVYNDRCCRCPIAWGNGPGPVARLLAEELSKHGVPPEQLESRCQQAIRAIGNERVQTALKSANPWRELKALGNNVKFKFILPNEMQKMIESNKGAPVGKRAKPASVKPQIPSQVELDHTKIVLMDGVFRVSGQPVPQITTQQLGPVARGVVLLSLQEADPYLRAGKLVSSEPLAMIVLHPGGKGISTALPHSNVTIPCKCVANNEPLLVEATLIQLGQGVIERNVAGNTIPVESISVATVKIMVYRDEYKDDWQEFCTSPIKHLVKVFPILRRCMDTGCRCGCWHNPEELPLKEPILDVWRRQFLRGGFKPTQASQAEIYSVSIRVPMELVAPLLSASGTSGAYTEPRTPDGKEVMTDYVVVWATKLNPSELAHVKQTNPAVVGMARLGDRRGLRVLSSHAQKIHELLRPDATFLPQGPKCQFVAGPFHWGTDRSAICKMMKQIGWCVKALQPMQPIPGKGTMWLLQSVDDPPNSVLATSMGEIVISKHKTAAQVAKMTPVAMVGAASTLSLCGTQPAKATADADPWIDRDPWGGWQPTHGAFPATPASDGVLQLSERIQNEVLAKIPAGVPMDQDDIPDRLAALEGQVSTLMAKNQSLESHFMDFSGKNQQQMAAMQTQLNNQGQQLHGHIENQAQNIQAMFAEQMAQIRGLLAKRPREDTME
eukprot:s237_g30.t1